MRTSNTTPSRKTSSGTSFTDSDARQQPASLPTSASSNRQPSAAQAVRTADAVRNRLPAIAASPGVQAQSHIEGNADAQDAVRARDYELQLVAWENPDKVGVDGRRIAAERIRDVIRSGASSLDLYDLNLSSLPKLPDGLTTLNVSMNYLRSLPALPNGLIELSASVNQLRRLPDLPKGLTSLDANNNWLTTLPKLPKGLTRLYARKNELVSMPDLPDGLTQLGISENQLTSLPDLPAGLTYLKIDENQLTRLPDLPRGLIDLKASFNELTHLQDLPDELTELDVSHNKLTRLPDFPVGLTSLGASSNKLVTLAKLPNGLTYLAMRANHLTSLPKLPDGLTTLYLSENPQLNIPMDIIGDGWYDDCAAEVRQWQLDHPDLVDRSADAPVIQPPASPGLTPAKPQGISNTTAPTTPVTLPATTPAAQHTDPAAITTPPAQQPSLTPDKLCRVEQLLGAITQLQQSTLTPEDRINVLALLSMQDAIETVVSQPAATLPREEMDKLIAFMQIKFENDREKQQLAAELAALNTDYPDTAKSGLLLYNLLSKTLIGLHNNAPQLTSGVANTDAGMASSKAAPAGVAISVLNFVPMVGNQAASAVRVAFNSIDQNHVRQNLLRGLDAMASIDNAGTPLEQQATMQRLTHALVYRLALHHCAKPPKGAGKVTTAVKVAVGIDDRSISNYQNYAKKITDAILKWERTFSGASVEVVVSHLLAAALTGATRTQDIARDEARLLGKKHQQIITRTMAHAGSGAVPAAPATAATPQSGHLPGTSKPAPDAAGQTGVHVLTAQMAQMAQQFAALNRDQQALQALQAQQEEDKRTVQTLQSAYQELIAQQHEDKRTMQTLQSAYQELMAQQHEDKRTVQTLQSANQELMAKQDEDKRTLQTLQSANQELMAQLAQNKQRLEQNDQRLEQNDQRFAAMESENSNLRTELQTLTNKPVDPMISTLHHAVDGLYAQLASLQTNLNLAHSSTANAHAELQTLTTQQYLLQGAQESLKEEVNALQLSLDETPEKAEIAALGNQLAGLVQHKQRSEADLRMLKKSVSKLEVESDSGTGSGSQILMARTDSASGRSVADQHAQLVALQDHVNLLSRTISEMKEQLGIISTMPVTDPDEENKRNELLGNLPE